MIPDTPLVSKLSTSFAIPDFADDAVRYLGSATTFTATGYTHPLNLSHRRTQWEITWAAFSVPVIASNMPLQIQTNASGPVESYENACCGDLTTLNIDVPLNRTRIKFRVRFQASDKQWGNWSEFKEGTTRSKDHKRPGLNPARDGVIATEFGAIVNNL